MPLYKIGSAGNEVRRIQEKLQALEMYKGTLDGFFGGGTEAAVKLFQGGNGLEVDGKVGELTWQKLFGTTVPASEIASKSLDYRCLALTGSFETGAAFPDCFAGLSGDFDGQGISFGVCQWNFGQGSLQPLLKRMYAEYPELSRTLFHDNLATLTAVLNHAKSAQMSFARSIQHPRKKTVNEPWRGMFKSLGRTDEFQRIETDAANAVYKGARQLCAIYDLWSERAAALMFDIKVQNGSIKSVVQEQIMSDFQTISSDLAQEEQEVAKLRIIANRRAEAAKTRWVEDVRLRKLCIANGGGAVHGIVYDLEEQFGIGLRQTAG